MKRLDFVWLAAFAAIGMLSSACGGETTPPPEETKAEEAQPAADAPAATEAPKFIAAIRGEALLGYTTPDTNVIDQKEVITTIRVQNLATTGAIAGLRIDEFWWDPDDNPVGGATARIRQPLGPGEVIDVELRTAYVGRDQMSRNSYNFSHANGTINPVVLDEIEDPVTEEEDGTEDSAESE